MTSMTPSHVEDPASNKLVRQLMDTKYVIKEDGFRERFPLDLSCYLSLLPVYCIACITTCYICQHSHEKTAREHYRLYFYGFNYISGEAGLLLPTIVKTFI